MSYTTGIWIVLVGAAVLSVLIVWSIGETRRHQQRGRRRKKTKE